MRRNTWLFWGRVIVTALTVTVTVGLATNAYGGNIVSDPGFETAALGGGNPTLGDGFWNVLGGVEIVTTGGSNSLPVPHSGDQMLWLDGYFAVNTLSQTLPTVVGEAYLVSYWVADTAPNSLSVNFGDKNLFTGLTTPLGYTSAADYVNESFVVVADSTATQLAFVSQWINQPNDSLGTMLDDVSVTPTAITPEPATFALFAVGLGVVKLWSRKASRR